METREFFKFVFIGNGSNMLIEAKSKKEAIEKLEQEAPAIYNSDFQVINIKSEIKINDAYVRYL